MQTAATASRSPKNGASSALCTPNPALSTPNLHIVSIHLRGHGGRYAFAHQVRSDETGALLATFGKIRDARRFIAGQGV